MQDHWSISYEMKIWIKLTNLFLKHKELEEKKEENEASKKPGEDSLRKTDRG